MKVVVTSPVWSLNGVNTFAANCVRGLSSARIDSRLLLTGVTYRERKPLPLPRDIHVEHLVIPRFASWRRRRRALVEYLESRAPCVYLPNHDFLHSSITSKLSPRVGVVGIVHSDDAQHYDHVARLGRTWNAAVAVSEMIATRMRDARYVEESRLQVIPYGVPVADAERTVDADRELRILYAGRLDAEQKRVGDLLEIASSLQNRGVWFSMTIAGDGPERASLARSIEKNGLESSVKLLPPVANDQMGELYAENDAFILPSAYEGMPIAMLEAMGQGCVPFAANVESGVREVITHRDNGFRIPVGDIERFADLLQKFAESPSERARMSRAAWQTVAQGPYTLDSMTSRYIELLESVSREAFDGSFSHDREGRGRAVRLSMRERIAAPLWFIRPSIRAQQKLRR